MVEVDRKQPNKPNDKATYEMLQMRQIKKCMRWSDRRKNKPVVLRLEPIGRIPITW